MIRLATQDKPFFSRNLEEKLNQIRSMGFDGFEVDGDMLLNHYKELKQAVSSTGVPVTSVCGGYRGWIGDFNDYKRRTAIEDISAILALAGEIGAAGIVVPAAWGMFTLRLPPMIPPRPPQEDEEVLIDSLVKLAPICRQSGTKIFLEPLNRYEDHMLNTLHDAGKILEKGDLPHVRITADFFHMNIEEKDISQSIKFIRNLIGHIHIADSHRYQPGDGHTDFAAGFSALKEIGFNGTMAFECRVLGEDQAALYAKSVEYIRDCWERAGVGAH